MLLNKKLTSWVRATSSCPPSCNKLKFVSSNDFEIFWFFLFKSSTDMLRCWMILKSMVDDLTFAPSSTFTILWLIPSMTLLKFPIDVWCSLSELEMACSTFESCKRSNNAICSITNLKYTMHFNTTISLSYVFIYVRKVYINYKLNWYFNAANSGIRDIKGPLPLYWLHSIHCSVPVPS